MGWEVTAAIVVVMLAIIAGLVMQTKRAAKYKERDRERKAEDDITKGLEEDVEKFRGGLGRNVRRKLRKQSKGSS